MTLVAHNAVQVALWQHCCQKRVQNTLQHQLTMVNADGEAFSVAHASAIREEDVRALLALLQQPRG
jgi:hypothetical protein